MGHALARRFEVAARVNLASARQLEDRGVGIIFGAGGHLRRRRRAEVQAARVGARGNRTRGDVTAARQAVHPTVLPFDPLRLVVVHDEGLTDRAREALACGRD
jgi:hypothetical protein